ncbi:MAG: HNH endonuclease [Pseudomonadota bacterium]
MASLSLSSKASRSTSDLTDLLAAGYRTEARIIAHLAEVERRKLHLKDGSESLYDYCTRVLHLSNSEAFHRITAARIARQFPIVFSLIEQRQLHLHLTAVCLLRDYLTPENHQELLAEACHKTKWQVQELLARRFPRADVESRVRKLPEPRPLVTPVKSSPIPRPVPTLPRVSSAAPIPIPVEPLSEARYRIQLNASAVLKEKLDRLRVLTSHANPSGDIAVVIERALDVALAEVEKRRFAKTNRPRASRLNFVQTKSRGANAKRDHVPNAVLRAIAERDGLQCTYRGANGCRCTARAFLQVHHGWPWARGGEETRENLRLLCASYNQLLAERDFGDRHITGRAIAGP